MEIIREIAKDILWVGGGDRRLALFENLFPLDHGVTYNSYVILDEKTALMDTVDSAILEQFLENLGAALGDRSLDYLVISHMEPDHCAGIEAVRRLYPQVTIVGNDRAFRLIEQFYGPDAIPKKLVIKEGDTLPLGRRTLSFIAAPMVHWPEVMFSYEASEGILFSADAFGSFGGYDGGLFSDEIDYAARYLDEARRYYANIVGKFGAQVQSVLKKAEGLAINMICPLHGPVLRGRDISLMTSKYQRWSRYEPEEAGVLLPYASMYGHTESAAHWLAGRLSQLGVSNIQMFDVSKTHFSYIIAEAFRLSHWVFAAPTYNMGLFSAMEMLLRDMRALNMQNRRAAVIGNGSWAPAAHTVMTGLLSEMKGIELIAEPVVIRSALKDGDQSDLERLAEAIAASVKDHARETGLAAAAK